MSLFKKLGFGKSDPQREISGIRDRVLAYCPVLQRKVELSVLSRMGNSADQFDREMSVYSALGILLTFIYARLSDKSVSHSVTMSVLDWATEHGIEKSHVAVVHAAHKVSFDDTRAIETLGDDIKKSSSYISPQHADIYSDIVEEIEAHINQLLGG